MFLSYCSLIFALKVLLLFYASVGGSAEDRRLRLKQHKGVWNSLPALGLDDLVFDLPLKVIDAFDHEHETYLIFILTSLMMSLRNFSVELSNTPLTGRKHSAEFFQTKLLLQPESWQWQGILSLLFYGLLIVVSVALRMFTFTLSTWVVRAEPNISRCCRFVWPFHLQLLTWNGVIYSFIPSFLTSSTFSFSALALE